MPRPASTRTAVAAGFALLAAGCAQLGLGGQEPPVYSVFFESNDDAPPPRALTIIDQAADYAKTVRPRVVDVTGYANRTPIGTDDYNQRLSERRAQAVRQALIARGVPADLISATGIGSAQSQTSDVVDRRVQIRFER